MDSSSTAPSRTGCADDHPCTAAPRRGRPRSEAVDQAILDAVERLMAGGSSLAELSMEGIAQEAGVAKATVYRRWPNKEALLIDVVRRLEEPEPELAGESVRDDVVTLLDFMRRRGLAKRSRWILKAALSQMGSLPEFKQLYHERVVQRRRELIRHVVQRGVERGELRSDLDLDLLAEILTAPMLVRSVLWDDAPLDDPGLPQLIVDTALQGVAARPSGPVPAG
ncbi:TetR/AcrR family transcriptional regulator [Peterkaempfera bronchialis]|uniref:TetR/AcrR family transcriptional regulator n=1 Tax=Peterkaempfera bronchialis TaxID=2126346 RepID=A0A345SU19_9ACTN|nr:TetR/AcrR family transcriptional regulator [Peterkaempfera bronchialis]AXI77224.1 TetR/AcrR family transcriptional regulator [Peterkaempfera bronchialis]